MRNKALFLNLGKEEAEVPLEEVEVIEPMDEASNLELDAHEDSVELADDEQLVDDAIDATESVEELTIATEAAIASGKGLNRIEAAALNMALKAAVGKYVQVDHNLVPAFEAYEVGAVNGESSKADTDAQNTETSKEAKKGLKATAKAFIDSIIAMFKKIGKKIVNGLKSIGDRKTSSIRMLMKLASRLNSMPDFKDVEIDVNGLNLHKSGVVGIDDIISGIEDVTALVNRVYEPKASHEESNFLNAGIEAVMASDGSAWEKARTAINGHTVVFFNGIAPNSTKQENKHVSAEYLGGRRVVMYPPEGTEGKHQLAIIKLERTDGVGETSNKIIIKNKEVLASLIDDILPVMVKSILDKKDGGDRLTSDLENIMKKLKVNPAEDARLSGNKDNLVSFTRLVSSISSFKLKIMDFVLVLVNNVAQIAEKALGDSYSRRDKNKDRYGKDEKQTA